MWAHTILSEVLHGKYYQFPLIDEETEVAKINCADKDYIDSRTRIQIQTYLPPTPNYILPLHQVVFGTSWAEDYFVKYI